MNRPRLVTVSLVAFLLVTPLFAKTAKTAKTAKKNDAAGSRCSFAHYPIAVGAINEYQLTSRQLDADKNVIDTTSNTYSEEVTAVESDQFRTKSINAGNISESKWVCKDEGIELKLDEYPGTKITTTGVTIPAQMEVGGIWNQTFESESQGSSQKSKTVNRIIRREEVVVPAGTFNAYRVDYEVESTIPEQAPIYVRGTQWFAPGVGIVKTISVIDMQQEEIRSIETTTELIRRISK